MPFPLKTPSFTLWLFLTGLACWVVDKTFPRHAIEYLRLSSIQRNIVLPCKRRTTESKLLALFKPLRNTFFTKIPTLLSFTLQPFKAAAHNSGRHIALVIRPKTHAMEACILNVTIKIKTTKRTEPKPQLGAFGPSKNKKNGAETSPRWPFGPSNYTSF